MADSPRALILGAGIGGLAAGISLRRAGWHVAAFERAAEPRPSGFGLVLAPNAMAALRDLGLGDGIRGVGVPLGSVEVRRGNGAVLRRFGNSKSGGQGPGTHFALRPALHRLLLDALGRQVVTYGRDAVGLDEGTAAVSLHFADGEVVTGDVLIAADGAASIVRRLLHPDEPAPAPSQYAALRGVAHQAASDLGELTAVGYLAPGVEAAVVRASPTSVYWYVSMLVADGPVAPDAPSVLARPGIPADASFRAVVSATRPEDMRLDVLFERSPLRMWGRGLVTLLGDAAHPVLPHTGQGAAQALEDAVAIGLALQGLGATEWAAALRAYERVRTARTRRVVRSGPRIARVTTTHNRLVGALRDAVVRMVPEAFLTLAARASARDPHRALRRQHPAT